MLLHDIVTQGARTQPDAPALISGDRSRSWAELAADVDALAGALASVADPGDRVAFLADNTPEWVVAYYAVPKAGLQLAFVNQRLGVPGIRAALAGFDPAVVIAGEHQLADLRADDATAPLAPTVVSLGGVATGAVRYRDLVADAPPPADVEVTSDDVAWLIATSGTSGTPKTVPLTHANLLAAVDATLAVRPMVGDETYLYPFPLCHVSGYNILQFHRRGRPVVLVERFEAAAFLDAVRRHGVTTASLAPTMVALLVDHLDHVDHRLDLEVEDRDGAGGPNDGADLGRLRAITYGSAPIGPDLLVRAMDRLGVDFHQGYGMTEMAGNGVFLSPDDHRRAVGPDPRLLRAAGRPSPLLELRVIDEAGRDVPTGHPGEIAVRGPQVTRGYHDAPAANAAAFVDGWFRTGDVGRLDADGYLSIVDRLKDLIVTGGENVASREVEDLLAAHPAVAEVAVVGVPDPTWGESVTAVVVPRPGHDLSADDVIAYGRTAIGGFKKPKHAVIVDALPRNGTGKVLKHRLRDLAAATLGAPDPAADTEHHGR